MKRFFVRSAQGIWFYDTAEEAKAEAERLLEAERYYATREGEWGEDATAIFWGEVHGLVEERVVNPCDYDGWHVEMELKELQ